MASQLKTDLYSLKTKVYFLYCNYFIEIVEISLNKVIHFLRPMHMFY